MSLLVFFRTLLEYFNLKGTFMIKKGRAIQQPSYKSNLWRGAHSAADEACSKAVLNRRAVFTAVRGQSLSLSCVVQHCGDSFTWKWIWKNSTDDTFRSVQTTDLRRLTRNDLSTNQSRLVLDLLRVNESDEGSFGCSVQWETHEVEQGHLMLVNVTEAVPFSRTSLHRILVCTGAVLCVSIVLALVICLRSKVTPQTRRKLSPVTSSRPSTEYQAPQQQSTPQPPPRKHPPQKHKKTAAAKAPPQKTEVVYADISQDALLQQQRRVKQQQQQSTVYSSVRFT
ncbi:hypothetical protein WMY93_028700 [Mugilogobius chulae]|uniref:Ig-like domain-containing protein n=1 Tax=Mugilogobius chulae TaxID=88201 RepID=A0AAW0MVA5_9GOBI